MVNNLNWLFFIVVGIAVSIVLFRGIPSLFRERGIRWIMKWVSKLVFALFFIGFPTIFLSDSYDPTAIVFMGIVVAVYIAVYALVIGTPLGIILLLLVIRLEDNQEWWSILALSSVISSLISASVLLSYRVDFTNGLLLIPLTGIVGAVFSIYLHQSIKGPVHY